MNLSARITIQTHHEGVDILQRQITQLDRILYPQNKDDLTRLQFGSSGGSTIIYIISLSGKYTIFIIPHITDGPVGISKEVDNRLTLFTRQQ